MELIELQDIWQKQDKKLSENIRLNREILRRMLISKSEKRMSWIKIKAGLNLILPIIIILLVLVPNIKYRTAIDFHIGVFLFGAVSMLLYYWSVRYYLLIGKIDFKESITLIKKNIYQLEKYKIKLTRLGYILMPFGILGVFLMSEFPIFSRSSLLPFSLIILVMIISIYYTFKYSIFALFRKLNSEIEEIEQLEKD